MKNLFFFLGKGGVGKSTLSTAVSCSMSSSGRILHVSLDPAHNIGDIYGVPLSDSRVSISDNLDAVEVDIQYWIDRYLKECRREMKHHYSYAATINMDFFFNIMKYSPGTEEFAVLWAIEHICSTCRESYDYIVFDTPPTALTLRFLAMPSISLRWVQELSSLREKILDKRQRIMHINPDAVSPRGATKKEDDTVHQKLSSISKRLHVLYQLFTKESYFTVVLNEDSLSLAETMRIREELKKLDIPIHSLSINKYRGIPDSSRIIREFSDCPLFHTSLAESEILTVEDLHQISVQELIEHFAKS